MMKRLVQYQLLIMVVLWLLAMFFLDIRAAMSVLAGGMCYFLPTVIAVSLLNILRNEPIQASSILLMIEGTKVLMAIIMIIMCYLWFPTLNWIAFIVGLVLVTQAGLLFIGKKSYYE